MKKFGKLVILELLEDSVTIGVIENGKVAYRETVGNGGGAFFFNGKIYYVNDFI